MHPDLEQLQRFRHGELPPPRIEQIRRHIGECTQCRARLDAAERDDAEFNTLLRHLDHAPAPLTAEQIVLAARRRSFARYRRAAIVLLALGLGGAAVALPVSPVARWVRARLSPVARPPALPIAEPAQPQPSLDLTGITVKAGRSLVIDFVWPQTRGAVIVSLSDTGDVVIRSPAGAARYADDEGRVTIDNAGSTATFQLQIPRASPLVEIRVAGKRIFHKQQETVTAEQPAESAGVYRLRLSPPQ